MPHRKSRRGGADAARAEPMIPVRSPAGPSPDVPVPSGEASPVSRGDDDASRTAEGAIALVDASNVAHSTEGEAPRLANILIVRDKLIEEGFRPIIVADAALRHQIDDRDGYERLVESGTLRQAPAGTDADYFLLSFARELDAPIVTNDRFKDRVAQFPEARDHVIRYMIVANEVVLERRTHRRD